MSSGFAAKRIGPGRCYEFWSVFESCARTPDPSFDLTSCNALREDYLECLHHKKEYQRMRDIQHARDVKSGKIEGGGGGH